MTSPPPSFTSPLSATFYMSLGALLAMLITAVIYHSYTTGTLNKRNHDYGQALASVAAKRAADATLNHDLVSLQVILRDIAQNPAVETATIHDVENRLLVQAGNGPGRASAATRSVDNQAFPDNQTFSNAFGNPFKPDIITTFAAPIVLHDSIAGYVTVNLSPTPPTHYRHLLLVLAGAGTLLAAVAIVSLYRQHQSPASTALPVISSAPMVDEVVALPTESPREYHCSTLTLNCLNLEQLRQQLNGQRLKQLLDQLEQHIHGVTALYNGELIDLDTQQCQLAFYDNHSLEESTFHAVCSALLLMRLQHRKDDPVYIQLNAAITPDTESTLSLYQRLTATERHQHCTHYMRQQPRDTVLISKDLLADSELGQRLILQDREDHNDFVGVTNIQEPYLSLLEKQYRQLQDLH